MKIKTKLKSVGLFFTGLVLVGTSLSAGLTALLPATSSATPPASGAIVNDQDSIASTTIPPQIANHNGGLECKAAIQGPGVQYHPGTPGDFLSGLLGLNGYYGNSQTDAQNFFDSVKNVPDEAKSTFAAAGDLNQGTIMINFFAEDNNNQTENQLCQDNSIILFRKGILDSGQSATKFYGAWNTGHYLGGTGEFIWTYISATVNTKDHTVHFSLPSDYSRKGDFTLKVDDPGHVFNQNNFPSGGGGGSAGNGGSTDSNCFALAQSSSDLQHCMDQAGHGIFTDAATIVYAGETYTATTWGNNSMTYALTKSPDQSREGSGTTITLDTNAGNGTDINLDGDTKGDHAQNDQFAGSLRTDAVPGHTFKVTLHDMNKAGAEFDNNGLVMDTQGITTFAQYYPKDDTVRLVFSQAGTNESAYLGTYTRMKGTNNFKLDGSDWNGNCSANLAQFDFNDDPKNPPKTYNGSTLQTAKLLPAIWMLDANNAGCDYSRAPVNVTIMPADATPPDGGATNTIGSSPEINCSVSLFNPLSWFLCPLASALETVVSGLDNAINNYLDVTAAKQNSYTTSCTGLKGSEQQWCGYYNAWVVVRNISLGLIAIFALVAIVSQAMGFELLDAYTIRKVLPRLFVAAIGLTLSWPLMMWFINLTDALGLGVRQLIYAPFSHYKVQLGGGGQFVSSFFVAGAIIALGFAGLLSFVATAALAAAVAFLVLTLRQMLIVLLVIFAPIAVACYVLPNTQKVWKLWWDSFAKALLMFPIIAAFIAIGRVFAAVSSTGAGSISQIIAFTAYFAPYFLLPFAFRLAGGAVSTVAGLANDRSRGMFDRLKKGRQERMADRVQRARNSALWDNNSKIGKRANKLASWATDPLNNAAYYGRSVPGLRKRGLKVAGAIEHGQVDQTKKLFEELNGMGFNDKAYRALSGTYDPESEMGKKLAAEGITGPPQNLEQLEKMASVLATGDKNEQIASNAIHNSMGRLATLYQDPEMGKASWQGAGIMGLAAHGFASSQDLTVAANGLQSSLGTGAAQSIIGQSQLLGSRSRPETKNGYGVMYDQKLGRFVDGMKGSIGEGGQIESRMGDVLDTFSSQDLAAAKGGAIKAVRPEIERRLSGSKGDAFARAQRDQLFSWAGPYSQASADVKAQALDIIYQKEEGSDAYMRPDLVDQFERYSREDMEGNPARRQGMPPPPEETGQQG